MYGWMQRMEGAAWKRLLGRGPKGFWERSVFWIVPAFLISCALYWLPGITGLAGAVLIVVTLGLLLIAAFVLCYRWVSRHLFWAVRNRIVVTCLLMGVAPVVLFGSLTSVSAYLLAGQFATNNAVYAIDEGLEQARDRVATYNATAARALEHDPAQRLSMLPAPALSEPLNSLDEDLQIAAWQDGTPLPVEAMQGRHVDPDAPGGRLPTWLHPGFSGVVQRGSRLFLQAAAGARSPQHAVVVLVSIPLGNRQLAVMGQGLGVVRLKPIYDENTLPDEANPTFASVQGGALPAARHFFDTRVSFAAPRHFVDWDTGRNVSAFIGVVSRPTALYGRLFSTSVRIGDFVRDVLLAMAILFGLLQLLAIYMAVRLSRTITQSVGWLYRATTEIDRGNLEHRIPVGRSDQLAALATSFNTMAGSLGELLAAQREQERMQTELVIAQEVQKNLFPHAPIKVPGLELHGVCKPARTVSGDYFDFIQNDVSELCVALGDISGKGISAALLMASLHSAVRAYCAPGVPMPSPAHLLGLLNQHLYRSTQPEKYATLFLACYQCETRELVYANGGQLPPFIICADGSVHALEQGGTVVGLLHSPEYQEGRIQLSAGDLLVAYSDGVTEPENEFGEFGYKRLLALVRAYRNEPLASISAHAMRELSNWIGNSEQPDDITLMLMRQT